MWSRFWMRTLGSAIPNVTRAEWLRWLLSAFGLWLMVATRPLWLNSGEFPQVPWFAWGCDVPRQFDFGLFALGVFALIAGGCTNANSRINCLSLQCVAVALLGLMLLDQHRCQPWAYQWLLMTLILAWTRYELAIGLLRALTISIYIHSAISKCDLSFCAGIGRSFLMELQTLLSGQTAAGDAWEHSFWPLVFPLGELLVACGLIWPCSRRWALWLATAMHLLLLLILGPWGLNHSAGVLIWNLFFLVQNWVLFGTNPAASVIPDTKDFVVSRMSILGNRAGTILTLFVVAWPLLEPWGYCDLWPAWGLYAQHGERITVRVTEGALRKLPTEWQETAVRLDTADGSGDWWLLRPQQVSLRKSWAPVYPQNRFTLGVSVALTRDAELPADQIAATWYAPARRWTGQQTMVELKDLEEIERAISQCRWNARPRNRH